MKRILSLILFFAICAAIQAQGNTQVEALFKELEKSTCAKIFSYTSLKEQHFDGSGTSIYTKIWLNKGGTLPSLQEEENKKIDDAISIIRRHLDLLAQDSRESYHYEFHENGLDTIQYAINLSQKDGKMRKSHGKINFTEPTIESITFNYETTNGGKYSKGTLSHRIQIEDLSELVKTERTDISHTQFLRNRSFPYKEYMQTVDRTMTTEGVTRHEIYWLHPDIDSVFLDENYTLQTYSFDNHSKGETTGYVYSVAAEDSVLALEMFKQLSDSTASFLKKHPINNYIYSLDAEFQNYQKQRNRKSILIWGQYLTEDSEYYDGHFDLYLFRDADGYHFLVLNTIGCLWIPKEFATLKKLANGKKIYYKKPKNKRR